VAVRGRPGANSSSEPSMTTSIREKSGAVKSWTSSVARSGRRSVDRRLFRSVVGGAPAAGVVSLTYDDGPTEVLTLRLGQALAERGHLATFFVLLRRAEDHAGVLRQLTQQGHEIGLHGVRHERLPGRGFWTIREELREAKESLETLCGHQVRLMRPPYGAQSRMSYLATRSAGLMPVGWSLNTRDYSVGTFAQLKTSIPDPITPGALVLLHDGDGEAEDPCLPETTIQMRLALTELLAVQLSVQGLRSVTVSMMLSRSDQTGVWIHGAKRALGT
jgi:peptidoglycan/xylan/chitin deacetylase (PgdA/CDA1 family)